MNPCRNSKQGASLGTPLLSLFTKHKSGRIFASLLTACWLGATATALATPVIVPNGDFSDTANNGSIGGGLLGDSGSGQIANGPWFGTYAGVVGLLAPPVLSISPGQAAISNIGVVVLGIANSGDFSQTLAAQFVPLKHYVLAADVAVGTSLLGISVLTNGNVGLALTNSSTTISSSQSSPTIDITGPSSTNTYHVALGYDSSGSDSGSIGVELFSNPTSVLAANLLSQVTFSNVILTQAPVPALPPSLIAPASGTPQAATVSTAFSAPLIVSVVDAEGDPLEGVTVTFTAPNSGASAVLSSIAAMTGVGGQASVTGIANNIAGQYTVVASVGGLAPTAVFDLTNSALGQPPITGAASGNQGQSATVTLGFACYLSVEVINGSVPAAGATVVFAAPLVGSSSILTDSSNNAGAVLTETTSSNGVAFVAATANTIAGSYDVTATATALASGPLGTPVLLATYPMTNLAVGDQIFANGFDPIPDLCGYF